MLFHAHKAGLDFELGDKRYVVPMGHEVEIPDHLAYVVDARGLLLTKGKSSDSSAKRAVAQEMPRKVIPLPVRDGIVTASVAAEELADVSGEDPPAGADDEEDDSDENAAQKTMAQLEKQGIRVPGKAPGKRK